VGWKAGLPKEATGAGSATATELAVRPAASRGRHREFLEAARGDVDITTAEFLLSIRRGVGEQANITMFEMLAGGPGDRLSCLARSATPAG
jgi:electron transfer flavoprotein alpha subunit